jgi:predicted Zn-dependent protease
MQKLGGSRPPKSLSTHPSPEDRIKDLRIYAEKPMPLYLDAKRGENPSAEEWLR